MNSPIDLNKKWNKLVDKTIRQLFHSIKRKVLWKRRLENFDQERPCVFVLSTGRVGTKTLSYLFGLAQNVFSYHEPEPYLYSLSKLSYQFLADFGNDQMLQSAFHAFRRTLLDYSLSFERGYVETSPQVTFLAPVILKVIPNVRFIHLVRDPRSVIRSAMRRGWYAGHPLDGERIEPLQGSEVFSKWKGLSSYQKNVWLWAETNRWIKEFTKQILPERTIMIRSEHIFDAKKEVLELLYNFIHATMPSEKKILKVLRKKLNAQESGCFPEISDWTNEMYEDLRKYSGNIAIELGYKLE